MENSLLNNDPVISTLFKAVTTDYIPPDEGNSQVVTITYIRDFLANIGVSKSYARKIINELFKDIKFMESLHKRIKKLESGRQSQRVGIFYILKLRNQTARTIAQKILKDDCEKNSMLLYAKLQVLRKFQEKCGSPELFSLIAGALRNAFREKMSRIDVHEEDEREESEYMPEATDQDQGKVINISDYITSARIY